MGQWVASLMRVSVVAMIAYCATQLDDPARAAGCQGVQIVGPADHLREATVTDFRRQPIGVVTRRGEQPVVTDCESDFYVVRLQGMVGVVRRTDVKTNLAVELPPCPANRMNLAENEFDRSSQGMGSGRMCKPQ